MVPFQGYDEINVDDTCIMITCRNITKPLVKIEPKNKHLLLNAHKCT